MTCVQSLGEGLVPSRQYTKFPSLSSLPCEGGSVISLQVLLEQHLNSNIIKLVICFSYLFI